MRGLLREYICSILAEGKVDDLKTKYEYDLTPTDVEQIAAMDPSPTKKYLEWMLKQYVSHARRRIDIPLEVLEAEVGKFDKHAKLMAKKDINQYQTFMELQSALEAVPEVSKTQAKRTTKTLGADKLYDSADYVLLYIKAKEAAVDYGFGTKWCIAMADADHYEKYHNRNSKTYYLFQKRVPDTDPLYKVAIVIGDEDEGDPDVVQLWNARNESILELPERLRQFEDIASNHAARLPKNKRIEYVK